MWKLTIEDDEQKQISLPLVHAEYGVGRDESNEIRLTERNISRRHATLQRNAEGWIVRDLESYNGTYINGLRVAGEQHVAHGDIVQLGDYRLEFVDEGKHIAPPPASDHTATPAAPQPLAPHHRPDRLVVVVGPQPGQEFFLDREHFSMGRSEEAAISVNHSSVSRFHAELFAVGNGRYEIIDKGSANGIRINGQEVRRGFIEAGDAVELGDVRLRFVGAGKIFRAGFDRSQALPAITGFDAAIKAGGAAKPSAAGSSILKMVGVGALLGVVGVGAAAVYVVANKSGTTPTTSVEVDDGQALLDEARKLRADKKLDEAHEKISLIKDGSSALKDPDVATIENEWAEDVFQRVEALKSTPDSTDKQIELLWKVRNAKRLEVAQREKAQKALQAMDVDVPTDIENSTTPEDKPIPTVRKPGTNTAPRPIPTPTASLSAGQKDTNALKAGASAIKTSLASRPVDSLSDRELTQMVGACQAAGDTACAKRAAAEIARRKANPAPSSTKPR